MTGSGDQWTSVAGDNRGTIVTGNGNVVYVGPDPGQFLELGIQHLKIGLHVRALEDFNLAMNSGPENPDVYYLSAVATLRGKSAFLATLSRIRAAETLIQAAIRLEPRGVFYYFMAYLGLDYYDRKSLKAPIPWRSSLADARNHGVTRVEIDGLFKLLSVNDPLPRPS